MPYRLMLPDGSFVSAPDAMPFDEAMRRAQAKFPELYKATPVPDSASKVFAKTLGKEQVPMVAGIAGFGAGAGNPLALALDPVTFGGSSIIGGLIGAGLASYGAGKAQDAILKHTGLDKALGVDDETMAAGAKAHPIASTMAEILSQAEGFRPGLKALPGYSSVFGKGLDKDTAEKLALQIHEARKAAAGNAAIGAVADAAQQKIQGQDIDPWEVAKSAAMGAAFQHERPWAGKVRGFGESMVGNRGPSAKPAPAPTPATPGRPLGESDQTSFNFGQDTNPRGAYGQQLEMPFEEHPENLQPSTEGQMSLDFGASTARPAEAIPPTPEGQLGFDFTGAPPPAPPKISRLPGRKEQMRLPFGEEQMEMPFGMPRPSYAERNPPPVTPAHDDQLSLGLPASESDIPAPDTAYPDSPSGQLGLDYDPARTAWNARPQGYQGEMFGEPPHGPMQSDVPGAQPSTIPTDQLSLFPYTEQGNLFGEQPAGPDKPTLLSRAINALASEGKATISVLQERLKLTYPQAKNLMAELQARNIVSAPDKNGRRTLLGKADKSQPETPQEQLPLFSHTVQGEMFPRGPRLPWELAHNDESSLFPLNKLPDDRQLAFAFDHQTETPPDEPPPDGAPPSGPTRPSSPGAAEQSNAPASGTSPKVPLRRRAPKGAAAEEPIVGSMDSTSGGTTEPNAGEKVSKPTLTPEAPPPEAPAPQQAPPPPTRNGRVMDALRRGDLGEALNHLMFEAAPNAGQTPQQGSVHPLNYLARALREMARVRDDRSAILEAEVNRIEKEQGRLLTARERQDLENKIYDPNLRLSNLGTTVLDDNGKPIPSTTGKLVYETKGNKFVLDENGRRIPKHTLVVDRLVKTRGKAFAGAKVNVERPDMTGADKAAIDRLKAEGKLAEYDPKTNTFHFTNEGLDNRTILHEMVHAATVHTLHAYETDPASLTPNQRQAAEHINNIFNAAKERLGEKFPDAFENVYEFVSHAATEEPFQQELAKIRVSDLAFKGQPVSFGARVRSLYDQFTYALARMFKLDQYAQNYLKPLSTHVRAAAREGDNALLQTSLIMHDLMASPRVGTDVQPLPRRRGESKNEAVKTIPPVDKRTSEQLVSDLLKEVGESETGYFDRANRKGAFSSFLKSIMTHEGRQDLIANIQNFRQPLKVLQAALRESGVSSRIYDAATGAAESGRMNWMKMEGLRKDLTKSISAYMDKVGIDYDRFKQEFHLHALALHEAERRHTKYLMEMPLDKDTVISSPIFGKDMTPAHERKMMVDNTLKGVDAATADKYRARLEELARNHGHPLGDSPNENIRRGPAADALDEHSSLYNVAGSFSKEQLAAARDFSAKQIAAHPELKEVLAKVKEIQEETKQLNKKAGYWPPQLDGLLRLYKYENYMPFKGDPKADNVDTYDPFSKRLSGSLSDAEDKASGRHTTSENPLLQTLVDAGRAAGRAGMRDFTNEVVRSIKAGAIPGSIVHKGITLEDRYNGNFSRDELTRPDRIFHYKDDGTLDVYKIKDQRMLEAIKGFSGDAGSFWKIMNGITSGIGRMHTAYNPAFAPYNFVRHAITSAGFVGADLSPETAARYAAAITSKIVDGGLQKAMKVARLLHNNDIDGIKALADTHPFYKEIYNYLENNGRAAYQSALNIHAQNENLMKDIGPSKIMSKLEHVDGWSRIWADTFELASRSAGFSVVKGEMLARAKVKGEDITNPDVVKRIENEAAQYTKNLFNFEEVGKYGREAGSVFMFLRPALTTAMRFHDAFAPAYLSTETAVSRLPPIVRDPETIARQMLSEKYPGRKKFSADETADTLAQAKKIAAQRVDTFTKNHEQRQKNARIMGLGMIGAGMALYEMARMMSDDDDQGRNKVATDNMDMWARNIRLPINGALGIDFAQIPWGWGFGVFGSIGAQLAGVVHGDNTVADMIKNIIPVAMEAYLPLPTPKYSPVDHPLAFIVGSVTPTFARPVVEFAMNVDEFGQEIYTNRMNQFGDPYTGGEKLPPMYGQITEALANNTGVVMEPKTLHFFLNSYADGLSRVGAAAHGAVSLAMGERDFDPKQDLLPLSSFLGRASSYDAREFADMEKDIQSVRNRLNMYKDRPEQLQDYLNDNPNAESIVSYYNTEVNGNLKAVRTEMKEIERSPELTPREKADQLKELRANRDWIMRGMIDTVSSLKGD